jgi:glycine/D-amino acid oxidase-like deaminating enzyme
MVSPRAIADVVVIGDGLIGLSTALELIRSGAKVHLIGSPSSGAASTAAAGLLIPALDRLPAGARHFYADSLDRFPIFVESLREFDSSLAILSGVVERGPSGDTLREADGAIDNVRLTAALHAAVEASAIATIVDLATELELGHAGITVRCHDAESITGDRVVLAAGAWTPRIKGLPRPLPVRPLKGQMIAFGRSPLDQAMMGDGVYLVPRGDETLVGATVEEAGFDLTITDTGVESLRRAAVGLCPELAGAPVTRAWAGTRPATPDMLPILGADPEHPRLIYACGHSKNGVLLTPATSVAISAICQGRRSPTPIDVFTIERFIDV